MVKFRIKYSDLSVLCMWIFFIVSCSEKKISTIVFPSNLVIDTIPFASEPGSNVILLNTMVQGENYNFVFDSGSPTTIINSKIKSIKVSQDTVYFHDILFQPHPSFRVKIDTLQLGGIKIINLDSYFQRKLNLDGIMGDDIIGQLVWKFDLINRKMYVTEDVKNFSTTGISIPFTKKGEHIIIRSEFEGVKMDLIVDTGYSGFISADKEKLKSGNNTIFWQGISTRQTDNPYASSTYSQKIDSTYNLAGTLKIGELELNNEIIELRNLPLSIIGMDFFKRFDHFILDYPNQMIHFGDKKDKSLDFLITSLMKMNTKGVTFLPSSSKAQIGRITQKAKEKGINYLDTVISIDGIPIVNRDSIFYTDQSGLNEGTNHFEYRPSKFMQLWNDFHLVKDTSVIELKRGDSSQTYILFREYNLCVMPDSIQDYYIYLGLPLPNIKRVKTLSDTYYFKFKTEELLPWGLRNQYR